MGIPICIEGGSISQCIAVQEARENPAMGWGGDRSKDTDKQVDNVNLKNQGGNSSDYTLRRLARDGHDELRLLESP
ncbi:hypothetical protein [Roseiconus lacunae]|uniref:Uncharacterized protein n=1 Tax=Roseiconus lacunae TaxID=2605694 RepID=A0ABT7PFL1_9BACT|nr:hypothetical protein [Roseiconus lacunae]MDM4015282.1 hypothetical protein [Roseiconus lacunae]